MSEEAQKIRISDDPSIRELYANKLISLSFDGNIVSVTLGTTRYVPEHTGESPRKGSPTSVQVTARLALSAGGAVELANALRTLVQAVNEAKQKAADQQQ